MIVTRFLWLVLRGLAGPLAMLVLVPYPIIRVLSIPLRQLGVTVEGAIEIVGAVLRAPARPGGR